MKDKSNEPSNFEYLMEEFDIESAKIAINNLLFTQLPGETTLDEMESISLAMLEILVKHHEKKD